MWIYNNQYLIEEFLQDWFLTQLIEKEAIDLNTKGRNNMRAICKLFLDGMNKTDSDYPIILQNITFNLFSHYLTTIRNKGGVFLPKESYYGVRRVFAHMY